MMREAINMQSAMMKEAISMTCASAHPCNEGGNQLAIRDTFSMPCASAHPSASQLLVCAR